MEERNYVVYIHTCNDNGKKYIGITGQNPPSKRWYCGTGSYNHNDYFCKAIRKHKWKNFKHDIVLQNLTKEEAEMFEIEMIKYHKTINRKYGYNISNGGESLGKHTEESKRKMSETKKSKHYKISEETREKYRKNSSGKNNPMYGKNFTQEHRDKIRSGLKEFYKNNDAKFLGRHHTEENKKILSEQHCKKFICVETGIIYKSPFYCCEELNIDYSYLCKCIKSGKICKGHHYKYIDKQ